MKKALRIGCILLLTVLILSANAVFSVAAVEDEAVDLSEYATISDEKHAAYASRLSDRVYNSRVSYDSGETVYVYGGSDIGYAYVAWHELPKKVKINWLDGNKKTVSSQDHVPASLDEYIPVPQEGVFGFSLTFPEKTSVSELGAYSSGQLPQELPQFIGPLQKPTVMVVTGYPGDELICFGGLLPCLVDQGVPVQLVYLNVYNRERQEECLRALWKMGIQNEPIFIQTGGMRSLDGSILKSTWETFGSVSKELINILDAYKPPVIVTHGKNKPFPLMAEVDATNEVLKKVFDKIKGRPWLKKIYLTADAGSANSEKHDFSTGYNRAVALYEEGFASMRTFHYRPYPEENYILYYNKSGKVKKADMLENISYTPLSTPSPEKEETPEPTAEATIEPTAEPTAEPTIEPTVEPTAEPTPIPTVEPTATPDRISKAAAQANILATPVPTPMPRLAETKTVLMPILLSLLFAAILFAALILIKTVLKADVPVIAAIMVPVLVGAIICVGMYRAASINQRQAAAAEHFDSVIAIEAAAARMAAPTDTPVPTPEPTAEPIPETTLAPTAEPTMEPTPEATPEPTPKPTATPDPDAGLYTDGEEIVKADADAGKWVYKNSTLSIEITRYTGKAFNTDFPYFVADIHMRADEFRVGFGDEKRSGKGKDSAMNIAKKYKAVLLITGDNLIHMDVDKKGVLIRDGWVYNLKKNGDIMLWHPETLSMETVPKASISTAQLIQEGGVENTVAFGPILIRNGVKSSEKTLKNDSGLFKINPRVGVGMVKPGHFVVVVGGYRSDKLHRSLGWTLTEFADLMESYGCTEAYNVDGGVSTCIVFMGERLNKGGNKKDYSQLRTLPDGLLFGYSPKVSK